MKKLFFLYQKIFWYVSQFGAEISKPTRFLTEFGMLVLLVIGYGYKIPAVALAILYISLIFVAAFGGWLLTKMGVIAYNQQLSNKQNEDLQYIKKSLRRLERKIR
jgi:hypothetical protein